MSVRLPSSKDLVALVADKDMEKTLRGLLSRAPSFGVELAGVDIFRHPGKDGGCRSKAQDFLRPFCRKYSHALVIFDREGCGRDVLTAEAIEQEVESRLSRNGWDDRAAVIVPDPELEIWVWSGSPHVDRVCGWSGRSPDLRQVLRREGYLLEGEPKPRRPKEAFRYALRAVRRPPSAALFMDLASTVEFASCSDRSFLKLKETLERWFSR